MKKIFTLLVMVALATCWVSCSDDDDKDEPDPTIPTMNEITLSVKVGDNGKLTLFNPNYIGEFGEEWEEEIAQYITVPQDLEINWGDGQTTNSTTHQYDLGGIYQVTIKGTGITSFIFESSKLQSIDITKAPNLVVFSIYWNQVVKILDVSKNFDLTYFICDGSKLTSLDVSKNTKLKILNCGNNNLSSIDVSKNTKLVELDCEGNNFTSLDVTNNIALKDLYCDNNKLTSLNLSKNTKLINLNCSNNQLTSLDLNKNTELIYLECKENPFTQESVNNLLTSLPMGKYDNGKSISTLWIDDKWDTSIAEEKGWKINSYF